MDEPREYATDAAIRQQLAAGPLPTATIAARLGLPQRTARHRLRQMRRSGKVATGVDGLHRLASSPGTAAEIEATFGRGDQSAIAVAPQLSESSSSRQGVGRIVAGLAVGLIALAAALLSRKPPAASSPTGAVQSPSEDLWRMVRW